MNQWNYILQMGIIGIVYFVFIEPIDPLSFTADEIILKRIRVIAPIVLGIYGTYISGLRMRNACYSAFDVNTGEIKNIHCLYIILWAILLVFWSLTFSWEGGMLMAGLLFLFPEPSKEQQDKIREKEKQSGSLF
mgnify:CR=1 FL=1